MPFHSNLSGAVSSPPTITTFLPGRFCFLVGLGGGNTGSTTEVEEEEDVGDFFLFVIRPHKVRIRESGIVQRIIQNPDNRNAS